MNSNPGLLDKLFYYAKTCPDREALVSTSLSLSYSQLADLVELQSVSLDKYNLTHHTIVGICLENDIEHLVMCLACAAKGVRSFTLPSYESAETRKLMETRFGANFVASKEHVIALTSDSKSTSNFQSQSVHERKQGKLFFSTSGTTGEPKLVEFTDQDMVLQAHRHIQTSDERFACLASIEHNFAKRHRLYCLAMGATNVFPTKDISKLIVERNELDFNVLHVSAFQAQELLTLPDRKALWGIRLKLGGSHVSLETRKRLVSDITPIVQAGYGTTETGAISFTEPSETIQNESVGACLPGIKLSLREPDGSEVKVGEKGEVWISGPGLFSGYSGKPELNQERLRDGWFRTGDIAYLDDRENIHLSGRADDMFVFNSMNIYPQEIESLICQHNQVKEACVIGRESPTHGKIPVAAIVPLAGQVLDRAEIARFVHKHAGLRRPRQITLVEALPRNKSGKVSRQKVVSLFDNNNQVFESILTCLRIHAKGRRSQKRLKQIKAPSDVLRMEELELDSLARMEVLITLETEFEVIITPDRFNNFHLLIDIVNFVENEVSKRNRTKTVSTSTIKKERAISQDCQLLLPKEDKEAVENMIKLFRRVVKLSKTTAQLNQALMTFENRLTPNWVANLKTLHNATALLEREDSTHNAETITRWLDKLVSAMNQSGEQKTQNFIAERIKSTVWLFKGPGSTQHKTLLLCFAGRGARQISIPNPVFMQYTNAEKFDIMMVSEPLYESYRLGVPGIGKNIQELSKWFVQSSILKQYSSIKVIGTSAGAYPAIVVGHYLHAEKIVSIAGRFHRPKQHPIRYLARLFHILKARVQGSCNELTFSYANDVRRDRRFAYLASFLTGGNRQINYLDERKVHRLLDTFLAKGSLNSYLKEHLFD